MNVRYTQRALDDLRRIEIYTRSLSPQGAARIGARIRDRIAALTQFPLQAPPGEQPGVRQLVITQTRFLAIYRVKDENIDILAILHHARRRRR